MLRTIATFFLGACALFGQAFPKQTVERGHQYFEQNCFFCHGHDAGGGEGGPDLTKSKLVAEDSKGDRIGPLVRAGRTDKGMPAFAISDEDLAGLQAWLHTQKTIAETQTGQRRGVIPADLQSGNAAAGKAYFDGAGACSGCHSVTGDLAKVGTKYDPLKLEERMLFPRGAKASITVKLKSGETVAGTLAYQDEFTIALRDSDGRFRSWPVKQVQFSVDDPAAKHADLLARYSDDDIHNLMAYLQTLR